MFGTFAEMLKNKAILSFVSFLVFIFSLIYQPLHDVMHHGNYIEHHDGISNTQDKCLVYEYQFASFDLPSSNIFESINFDVNNTSYFIYASIFYSTDFNNSSSRAPPSA